MCEISYTYCFWIWRPRTRGANSKTGNDWQPFRFQFDLMHDRRLGSLCEAMKGGGSKKKIFGVNFIIAGEKLSLSKNNWVTFEIVANLWQFGTEHRMKISDRDRSERALINCDTFKLKFYKVDSDWSTSFFYGKFGQNLMYNSKVVFGFIWNVLTFWTRIKD